MDEKEMTDRCNKVISQERCKHGMVYEYCAHCQEIRVEREYKFPLTGYDDETGEEYTAWIGGVTTDIYYHQYREANTNGLPKARTTKAHSLGYKVHTVDSAMKPERWHK